MLGITLKKKVIPPTRAELWAEFKRDYQAKLAEGTEMFAKYCEEFRAKWLAAAQ